MVYATTLQGTNITLFWNMDEGVAKTLTTAILRILLGVVDWLCGEAWCLDESCPFCKNNRYHGAIPTKFQHQSEVPICQVSKLAQFALMFNNYLMKSASRHLEKWNAHRCECLTIWNAHLSFVHSFTMILGCYLAGAHQVSQYKYIYIVFFMQGNALRPGSFQTGPWTKCVIHSPFLPYTFGHSFWWMFKRCLYCELTLSSLTRSS